MVHGAGLLVEGLRLGMVDLRCAVLSFRPGDAEVIAIPRVAGVARRLIRGHVGKRGGGHERQRPEIRTCSHGAMVMTKLMLWRKTKTSDRKRSPPKASGASRTRIAKSFRRSTSPRLMSAARTAPIPALASTRAPTIRATTRPKR